MSWSTIWIKSEVGAVPSSKIFLLTVPRRCFFCRSFSFFLSCVCYAFVHVCLFLPCGHLLGKGWPLSSSLWWLILSLSLSHWYPGSGVVLDCIDSWSLHSTFTFSKLDVCLRHLGSCFYLHNAVLRLNNFNIPANIFLLYLKSQFCWKGLSCMYIGLFYPVYAQTIHTRRL